MMSLYHSIGRWMIQLLLLNFILMKSKKLLTALSLGAITLSVMGTQLISTAAAAPGDDLNSNAAVSEPNDQGAPNDLGGPSDQSGPNDQGDQSEQGRGERRQNQDRPKLNNVVRTVTNLSNGVQITCTSTDAATVAKLQSKKHPDAPKDGKVTVVHTNIANGIQVTITSSDADLVTKIQAHEKNGGGPMGKGDKNGGKNNGQGMQALMKNVKVAAQNTADGATITLSSTDAATVTKIQDFAKHFRLPPPGKHGPRQGGQNGQGRQSRQSRQGGQQGGFGQAQGQGGSDQEGPGSNDQQGGPAQQ